MILADTSVWIDYLRGRSQQMGAFLQKGRIVMHSLVAAEIALVSLRNRRQILEELDQMDRVTVAQLSEVRRMVEDRALFSRGIGLTDAHLVASCLLTRGTDLWTKDILLQKVAESLGIRALI